MEVMAERPRAAVETGAASRVAYAVEQDILAGRLAPGAPLDEAALGARFGVSRTPVREALRLLAMTGLVELRWRSGAVVASPTVGEMVDLFETVAELEAVAARLAAERAGPAERAAIEAAYAACCDAADGEDANLYFDRNGAFHAAIRQGAGNAVLAAEIERLDKRLKPYRRFVTFRPGRTATALLEHDAIAAALAARDGEAAAREMRAHVRILADDALAMAKSLRLL